MEKVNITFKSGTTITVKGENLFDKLVSGDSRDDENIFMCATLGLVVKLEEVSAIVRLD